MQRFLILCRSVQPMQGSTPYAVIGKIEDHKITDADGNNFLKNPNQGKYPTMHPLPVFCTYT